MTKPFLTVKSSKRYKKPTPQVTSYVIEEVKKAPEPYFTYIDKNGVEQRFEGRYNKLLNGSYVYEHSGLIRCIVEDVPTYSYNIINPHFSYYDKDGNERTCNRIDTIIYDEETNSYTGDVGEIFYEDEEIEIYENK